MKTLKELKTLYAEGKRVLDTLKDVALTEQEWLDYMKKTYSEAEHGNTTFKEWCNDSDFVDIENEICKREA